MSGKKQAAAARFRPPHPELKLYQSDTGTLTPGAATPFTVDLVGGIANGAAYNNRIGNVITVRRITIHYSIDVGASAGQPVGFGLRALFDDDSTAANMLLSSIVMAHPDPNVSAPMGRWHFGNILTLTSGGGDPAGIFSFAGTLQWQGQFPVRWDRAGNLAGPVPTFLGVLNDAAATYRVVSLVEFADA